MSKIKEITQANTDQKSLGNGLQSTQAINPVEEVNMFNTVMNAHQSTASHDERQEGKNNNEEESKEVQGSEKSAKAKGNEAQSNEKSEKLKKTEVTEEEKLEVAEIDAYQISLQDLAKQLDVVINQTQIAEQPEELVKEQIVAPQAMMNLSQEGPKQEMVNPDLLRKVDVRSLRTQLEAVINAPEDIHIEAPSSVDDQEVTLMNPYTPKDLSPEGIESMDGQDVKLANFLNGSDYQIDGLKEAEKASNFEDPLMAVRDVIEQRDEANLNKVLNVYHDHDPAVTLDVVSVDLTHEVSKQTNDKSSSLSGISDIGKNQTMSELNGIGSVADSKMNQAKVDNAMRSSQQQSDATKTNQQYDAAFLGPINTKVEMILGQLARNAKSQNIRIQIWPPHLGAIDIKFEVKNKNVQAEIVTQHHATKDLLEKNVGQLKNILMSDDFQVDKFDIKMNDPQSGADADTQDGRTSTERFAQQDARQSFGRENETKNEQMEKFRNLVRQRRLTQDAELNFKV